MRPPLAVSAVLGWARRRLLLPAGLVVAVGVVHFAPALPGPAAEASGGRSITPGKRRDEVVDVYEKVKGAVVNIHSKRSVPTPDDPFRGLAATPQQVNGMGTGIVLDPRGYILTNFHVVDDVSSLQVRLHDGTGFTARVIATDREADLALLKIDAGRPLPLLPF